MKAKKSLFIIGLVTIAAIAAGTVIGVNLTTPKQQNPQTSRTLSVTDVDNNTIVSLKIGDHLNLTLSDYGDGGYVWRIIHVDSKILSQTNQFTWGSSGMLGDFGKDTWLFTATHTGSTTLELRSQRPFGENDICQTFKVDVNIQ
jgi:predicted secreted protein